MDAKREPGALGGAAEEAREVGREGGEAGIAEYLDSIYVAI